MNSPITSTIPFGSIFRLPHQVESTAALNTRQEPSVFPSTPSLMQEALRHGKWYAPPKKGRLFPKLTEFMDELRLVHRSAPFLDASLGPEQQAKANRKARNERKRERRGRR